MPEHSSILSDSRFASLRGILPHPHEGGAPVWPDPDGRMHAAVSLILRQGPELELLLIKRAEAEGDPWSGHMALPGGRRDPSDVDLLGTAIRETEEETGIRLDRELAFLGPLEPVIPASPHLPPISIYPFAFGVGEATRAQASSREVDAVLWTPLSTLTCPSAACTVHVPLGDVDREFPCLRVEGRVVWGLTYRILTRFFEILPPSIAPPPTLR